MIHFNPLTEHAFCATHWTFYFETVAKTCNKLLYVATSMYFQKAWVKKQTNKHLKSVFAKVLNNPFVCKHSIGL